MRSKVGDNLYQAFIECLQKLNKNLKEKGEKAKMSEEVTVAWGGEVGIELIAEFISCALRIVS